MIMHCRLFLTIALLVLGTAQTFAHAFWIETNTTGKKGQAQEVRVYFGEYADKDISPLDKWFSDTKDYKLTLITPDNKAIPLTSTPGTDHYKAVFTPETDGVYTIVLQHTVKDVYHGSRLEYHASAVVQVGKSNKGDVPSANNNAVSIYTVAKQAYKTSQDIILQAWMDQQPASKKEVEVVAPNGWAKKVYTDSTGKAAFSPEWPGRYMLEVAGSEKKAGEHNGKPYEKVWRCATYCIEVTK